LSGAIALDRGLLWRPLGTASIIGFIIGSVLFAGDLTLRAFAGARLFPMAAPAGGIVLIGSWLGIAVAAAVVQVRG
jgi:uncharacterized membrane protein YgdD (TMEM256/DUF423 family)